MIKTIKWQQQKDKTHKGKDGRGNIYRSPCNQETVTVITPDGFRGQGWTAGEALVSAENERALKSTQESELNDKPPLKDVLEIISMKEKASKIYEEIDQRLAGMLKEFGAGRFDYELPRAKDGEQPFLKFVLENDLEKLAANGYIWKSVGIKPVSFSASGLKHKPRSLK